MTDLLSHLDRVHGGAARYLTEVGGLDASVLGALRAALLVTRAV